MLRIRELRQERHLSQEQLARIADVTTKTIARAETDGSVTVRTLRRIAEALGVPVAELFEPEEPA